MKREMSIFIPRCEKECTYLSESEGPDRRGRPLRRWNDGVKEYKSDRGTGGEEGLEQVRRECLGRKVDTLLLWLSP